MNKERSVVNIVKHGGSFVEKHRHSIFLSSNALTGIAAASGRFGEAMIFAGVVGVSGGVMLVKDVIPGTGKLISKVVSKGKNK